MAAGDPGPSEQVTLAAAGVRVNASGPLAVLVVILIAGFGGLAWITHEGVQQAKREHDARRAEHLTIIQSENDLGCVLMLDPDQRLLTLDDPLGPCHFARMIRGQQRRAHGQ